MPHGESAARWCALSIARKHDRLEAAGANRLTVPASVDTASAVVVGDAELQTWLTVAALARRLGRAESTIRSWRDRYAEFVPEQTDEDGRLVYPLERLAEIQALHSQSLTPREVSAALAHRHGAADSTSAAPARLDPWQTDVTERLERIESVLERLAAILTERNDADADVPQ